MMDCAQICQTAATSCAQLRISIAHVQWCAEVACAAPRLSSEVGDGDVRCGFVAETCRRCADSASAWRPDYLKERLILADGSIYSESLHSTRDRSSWFVIALRGRMVAADMFHLRFPELSPETF